jgi:ankyrin repeat protein
LLAFSAYYSNEKTALLLLKHGADCTLKNMKGETAAKVAINNDQHKIAGILMTKRIEQISTQHSGLLKAAPKLKERNTATA